MWPELKYSAASLSRCSHLLSKKCLYMLQVGGVDPKQLAVYEEFARNIPGFLPSNDLSQPTGFLAQPMKVNLSPVTIPKQNVRTEMVSERGSLKVSACLIT